MKQHTLIARPLAWVLACFCLFVFDFAQGQRFNHVYTSTNFEQAAASTPTSDGGTVIVADYPFANQFLYISKTNFVGFPVWSHFLVNTATHQVEEIKETADGGFILTGVFVSPTTQEDVFLLRLDNMGNPIWSKYYNRPDREFAHSVIETEQGGFVIAGEAQGGLLGSSDVLMIHTDANGNSIWEHSYSEDGVDEIAYSVIQTLDGNLAIAGVRDSFEHPLMEDVLIMKVERLRGSVLWYKWFGEGNTDIGLAIRETSEGTLAVTGRSEGITGIFDAFLLQTNSSGGFLSWFNYGGTMMDEGKSLEVIPGDDFIIGGSTDSYSPAGFAMTNFLGIRVQNSGAITWSRIYGGNQVDALEDVHLSDNGGFYLYGNTQSFVPNPSDLMYQVRTDGTGDGLCNDLAVTLFTTAIRPDTGRCKPYCLCMYYSQDTSHVKFEYPIIDVPLCVNSPLRTSEGGETSGIQASSVSEMYALAGGMPDFSNSNLVPAPIETSEIKVVPNPCSAQVEVRFGKESVAKVWLIDSKGKVLAQKAVDGNYRQISFDVSDLTSGTYLVRLQMKDGSTETKRMVKY